MNRSCQAALLGLSVAVALSLACANYCEFPHKGDGGVLDQNQGYINDSALVWVDVAKNCFHFVTNRKGNDALNSWIDASQRFNVAMENGDQDESFKMLYRTNKSFKTVAPFIRKSNLSKYFVKVYKEFGALLKTKNLQDINAFMKAAYPQFKEKLGCQNDQRFRSHF